jgi:hypothetical protein
MVPGKIEGFWGHGRLAGAGDFLHALNACKFKNKSL